MSDISKVLCDILIVIVFINLYNIGGKVTKENRTKIMIAGKTPKF